MTPATAHGNESVLFQDATNLRARENSELPNPYLDLGYENLFVSPSGNFRS